MVGSIVFVLANSTSEFSQTINAGTLTTDIVDGSYVPVASPTVAMGAVTFSFACQPATGTFGTATENIYVQNPDAADNGWTLAVAPPLTTNLWTVGGNTYDFNDPTGAGCTDGADADARGGQMTVDPTGGTLLIGQCASCATTGVSLGASAAYSEGVTNSVGLLSAAAGSDDIGDWRLRDIDISQQIPAEQPAAAGYAVSMVLTVATL